MVYSRTRRDHRFSARQRDSSLSFSLKITTWNVEWASPTGKRGPQIARILRETNSDIIVLTEGCRSLLPSDGYTIEGSNDWGYGISDPARRKVVLWSRYRITHSDVIGSPHLPTGRFVSGVLSFGINHLKVIGVCIPWSGAHVRTGRRDRELWQDHNFYLEQLALITKSSTLPLLVAGDFNQRLPRQRQPIHSYNLMTSAFQGMKIHSEDFVEPALIDHIATTREFKMIDRRIIFRDQNGLNLSDHDGVSITLESQFHQLATE